MPNDIRIEVHGIERVQAALKRFPHEFDNSLGGAAQEIAREIIYSQGIGKYPPGGPGNAPPTPYYVRGRGTQYAGGNDGRSERYGTQFYVSASTYRAEIGNRASYAKYLGGENQAAAMGRIGWLRLIDVAEQKAPEITRIFQGWVDKLIERLGL